DPRSVLIDGGVGLRGGAHGPVANIPALQGGMGELPAAGLVRLMVDDHHYSAGRAVIERWEASTAGDSADASQQSAHDEASPDDVTASASIGEQSVHGQPHRKSNSSPQRRRDGRNPFGMWIAVAVVATACWLYARAVEAVDPGARIDGRATNVAAHPAPPSLPGHGATLRFR
ncbi:MAG: hypothetical protein B7Z51_03040, partial [Methyloversatilis sp. 12-65-5]